MASSQYSIQLSKTTTSKLLGLHLLLLLHYYIIHNYICYFIASGTTSATSSLQELHLLLHRFRNYICYFIASGTTSIDTTSGITSATSLLNMATEQEYDDIYRYKTSTQKYRPGLSDNEKRNIRDKASR